MKVVVDGEACQGHGRCYALAPTVFAPDEIGNSSVVATGELDGDQADLARRAAENCPEHAITVVE